MTVRPSASQAPNTISFDERGDLRLEIGDADDERGQTSFLVCSRALARTSPVFKAMLFGGYAESKPAHGEWVVQLPDDLDHIDGLRVIMDIVHGNFHKVHKDINNYDTPVQEQSWNPVNDLMCDIAIMADKYVNKVKYEEIEGDGWDGGFMDW
jgi:hypothetical protein